MFSGGGQTPVPACTKMSARGSQPGQCSTIVMISPRGTMSSCVVSPLATLPECVARSCISRRWWRRKAHSDSGNRLPFPTTRGAYAANNTCSVTSYATMHNDTFEQ